MKIILVICVLAAFILSSTESYDDPRVNTIGVCENIGLRIVCGSPGKIKIVCASYGRSVPYVKRCHSSVKHEDTSCLAKSSVSKVKELCEGKGECVVKARNDVFGDPCVGTYKYLDVVYKCES